MIDIKICKKCNNPFDIATNYDFCPNCRSPKMATAYDLFQTQLNQTRGNFKKMAYKEINPTDWTYDKEGDFIEGFLVQIQKEIGPNKSKLYSIETPEGVKNVWGATLLDSRMALTKVGDKIKITYKGLAEASQGKNPAKIFKVEIDE
ncbi:hypothetical protein ES702_01265 [subsurface metagenome]